jgi:hypothetical protein
MTEKKGCRSTASKSGSLKRAINKGRRHKEAAW